MKQESYGNVDAAGVGVDYAAIQPINTHALDTALEVLVGVEGAGLIKTLYGLLDNAESKGLNEGFASGWSAGSNSQGVQDRIDDAEREGFENGWEYGVFFANSQKKLVEQFPTPVAFPCDVEYDFTPNNAVDVHGDIEFTEDTYTPIVTYTLHDDGTVTTKRG